MSDVRRILVTGASGFLGSDIVLALATQRPQDRITALDLKPPRRRDVADKLEKFFQADITDPLSLQYAFSKPYTPDLVVHSAGIVPTRSSRYSTKQRDWDKVHNTIYNGTVNVLAAALDAGCKNFVYTSSITAVIDDLAHDYHHMDETTRTGLATLHYGKAKAMTEDYLLSAEHASRGLKVCVLRPCTIIGPEDTQVISVMADLIPKGETLFVLGDGNNISDWMYIDNAVHAHVLAVENLFTTQTCAGHAIFITNHEPIYFWDFVAFVWAQFDHVPPFRIHIPIWLAYLVGLVLEVITKITGRPSTLDTGSVKDGIRTFYTDNKKAIELLGYKPKVGLSEGVRRACDGYKKQIALRKAAAK